MGRVGESAHVGARRHSPRKIRGFFTKVWTCEAKPAVGSPHAFCRENVVGREVSLSARRVRSLVVRVRRSRSACLSGALMMFAAALVSLGTGMVPHAGAATARVCATGVPCLDFVATTGVANSGEPSGMAPPTATALRGYAQTYATDFAGSTLPSGWSTFNGVPGGDPGAMFAPSQVSVAIGELQLTAGYDSSQSRWLTGGACRCQASQQYGAYFVRSRMTGPGPTVVELLWPSDGNSWPPEVDFNETYGGTSASMATVHFGAANNVDHRNVTIDMTKWHTWGVVWTPNVLTYVVDGRVWGVVNGATEVPHIPMTLHVQQQTWCSKGFACPTSSQATLVDWVSEYSPQLPPAISTGHHSATVAHITIDAGLTPAKLSLAVQHAAQTIRVRHVSTVNLRATVSARKAFVVSPAIRVEEIEWMLEQDVRSLNTSVPNIFVHWTKKSAPRAALKISLTLAA